MLQADMTEAAHRRTIYQTDRNSNTRPRFCLNLDTEKLTPAATGPVPAGLSSEGREEKVWAHLQRPGGTRAVRRG